MIEQVTFSKWQIAKICRWFFYICFIATFAYAQTPLQNSARLRLAQDLERMGQYDRAVEIYLSLFNAEPRDSGYYFGLKRVLLQLRRYDDLIAAINRRLQMMEDINARVDLGDVYYKRSEIDRAQALWKELIKKNPQQGTYSAVAAAMIDNRLYDEALQIYLQGRQQMRNPMLFVLELANLYTLRLNYATATTEYLRYLEANPRQFPFVQSKINELARDDETRLEAVVATLERTLPQATQPQTIHRLLAGVFMQNRQFERALQAYQALERLSSTEDKAKIGAEIFAFAEQARHADAPTHAEKAYLIIVRDMPTSPYWLSAQFGLAQALQAQSKFPEALAAYAVLIDKSPAGNRSPWALRALLAQGEIYFEHLHDMAKAVAIYTQIYDRFPQAESNERIEAIFRLGDCYLALGDTRRAADWYGKARLLAGNRQLISDKIDYRMARLAFYQGRFREAQKLLEEITNSPVGENETESMVNDALELLLLIDGNMADSAGAFLSYARAEYAAAQYHQAAAIDTLEDLLQRFPQATILPQALFSLGNLYASRQQFDLAIDKMRRILNQYSQSIVGDRALFRLAEIHETNLRDPHKAQEFYEQLLRDYPQSLYLEEARRRARELAEKNKSS